MEKKYSNLNREIVCKYLYKMYQKTWRTFHTSIPSTVNNVQISYFADIEYSVGMNLYVYELRTEEKTGKTYPRTLTLSVVGVGVREGGVEETVLSPRLFFLKKPLKMQKNLENGQ